MALADQQTDPNDLAWQGIQLCRQGSWRLGFDILRRIADDEERQSEMPGLFYSYLGFGIARFERRIREGLQLCEHAVKREFYQPENYLNLARTELLAGRRGAAMEAIAAGRRIDPDHAGLSALHDELGIRRPPVLRFLSRRNLLNRLLGKLRHDWKRDPEMWG